jgi:hypothetical protein
LENCLKNASTSLIPEIEKVADQLSELRSQGAIAELELAFTKDWERCDWFASNCWLRTKIDVIIPPKVGGVVHIRDWKSGKVQEDHTEYDMQLELYQLVGLLAYPTAETAMADLSFVEHGVILEADNIVTRDMIEPLKQKWAERAQPLLSDVEFAPRPSGKACRWCDLGKAAGCEYAPS